MFKSIHFEYCEFGDLKKVLADLPTETIVKVVYKNDNLASIEVVDAEFINNIGDPRKKVERR